MGRTRDFTHIPIIDVSGLVAEVPSRRAVAERLGEACRESGFFEGTYGDYLLNKVGKIFPELRSAVL